MTEGAKELLASDAYKDSPYKNLPIVALENGGGVRATIRRGDITVGDSINVLPFGNTLAFKAVSYTHLDVYKRQSLDREIESGYVGDLLSWVMANADNNCAWVTIQTHMNIIAVATLLEMACIIIPEGAEIEEDTLAKATEENIPIITTEMNAYQVCTFLGEKGI